MLKEKIKSNFFLDEIIKINVFYLYLSAFPLSLIFSLLLGPIAPFLLQIKQRRAYDLTYTESLHREVGAFGP